MIYKPHNYQKAAIDHILKTPAAGLFLGLGLGKTSITLSALEDLINSIMIRKPLIIAPKLVTEQTWKAEIDKWDHTKNLTISRIIGNEKQRIEAIKTEADIYAVSRDNIVWLVTYMLKQPGKKWPYDYLVIDESSSFKNRASQRFKALRKVTPHVDGIVALTATPAPNSLLDLWPQMYLLDQGQRLGKTLTGYRDQYFRPNPNGFGYLIRDESAEVIHDKVKDICISMSAADYLTLPPRIDIIETIDLHHKKAYDKFKKEEFLQLTDGEEITPLSAAALYNKLLQFCNGAVYDDEKKYHLVDTAKLEALVESYEALNGEPVIIFYQFKSDLKRIREVIKDAQVMKNEKDIERWNRGEIKCLVAHPASMGHGLNLQDGGHNLFWYGMPWSLELYLQAVGRVDRQGQKKSVINKVFIARGTVEEIVVQRLNGKKENQDLLLAAVKAHFLS